MVQLKTINELNEMLSSVELQKQTIAFVPTMGALHEGHLKLIEIAKKNAEVVIASIFVNPLQFNKKEDFDNYPNRLESDLIQLQSIDCDYVFTPANDDLYSNYQVKDFEYGLIGEVLEGQYRPGHFNGMLNVIYRFLELIKPDIAVFGEKDYQQVALVRWLVKEYGFSTSILEAKTIREKSGLALSSRNLRLNEIDKKKAEKIIYCLEYCRDNKSSYTPKELKSYCINYLNKDFDLEYFEIVDENSMIAVKDWQDTDAPRALTAAVLSGVRLIDNLSLK